MSVLSDYRASIKRIVEAENIEDAFLAEGFNVTTAGLMSANASFNASRSVAEDTPDTPVQQRGRMSQGQTKR